MSDAARTVNRDVTVVVTCFNYGEFLQESVGSALAQDGGSPRVIVVDDGSTEASTLTALEHLPPEVTVIRQENAGLSAARNTGVRASDTPYFMVLDADDRLAPDALLTLKPPLEADPTLGFTYGITEFFDEWSGEMTMPPYDPYRLLYRHTIGSTCLARREVFDTNGGYDPVFRGFEDWEFWLNALEHGWEGRQVRKVTFFYRRHGSTMLSGARRDYRTWYRRLREKHRPLYARRAELARRTDTGFVGRQVYRWYWGPRPIPGAIEQRLYGLIFRA